MTNYAFAFRNGALSGVIATSMMSFGCGGAGNLSGNNSDASYTTPALVKSLELTSISSASMLTNSTMQNDAVTTASSSPVPTTDAVTKSTVTTSTASSDSGVLLQEENVTGPGRYIGSFRVPLVNGPNPYNWSGAAGWSAPGTVVWYNENGNKGKGSLVMAGRAAGSASYLTEISVPDQSSLDATGNATSMRRAQFLVPAPYFFDLSAGQSNQTAPGDGNGVISGGVFIADGNIYQNWGSVYQGIQTTATYFKKAGTDITSGQTSGPFAFSSEIIDKQNAVRTSPIWYRGVVAEIPSEWQSALGGRYIQSQTEYSNSSPTGYGPALFTFDPRNIGSMNPVPNKTILGYSPNNPIEAEVLCARHKLWTRHLSSVSGTV